MRTNIEINDKLMKKAMRLSGFATKRATVESALQSMVDIKSQSGIRKSRGKIQWEGDLEQSRLMRFDPDNPASDFK